MTGAVRAADAPGDGERLLEEFLAAVARHGSGSRLKTSTGWSVSCPVPTHGAGNGDRHPSLSVNSAGDRLLVHCHAGCSYDDVVHAVGWDPRDTFVDDGSEATPYLAPVRTSRPTGGVQTVPKAADTHDRTDEHIYTDEQGTALFRVVVSRRVEGGKARPKQHAWNGARGDWDLTLGSARRVLYRLPAVLYAVGAGAPVFVVEGEKGVETAERLGLVATTNPGGAFKWSEDYTAALAGADVVALPDNDNPGRQHAAKIVEALTGVARQGGPVRPPPLTCAFRTGTAGWPARDPCPAAGRPGG